MHINWRQFSHIGAAMLGTIVPGVATVEELAWQIGGMTGAQKADSVVTMGTNVLASLNTIAGRTLADDDDVQRAIRAVVDAVVAFHKIIASKATAAGLKT